MQFDTEAAERKAADAERRVTEVVDKIVKIADAVRDGKWKTHFVPDLDTVVDCKRGILSGAALVPEDWPTREEFSEAVDAYREAQKALKSFRDRSSE